MERHAETARRVVHSFREALGPRALREISEDQFRELELLVEGALSDELHHATEEMGDLVRRMRSEVELPRLDL